jgi:hypothetical protein
MCKVTLAILLSVCFLAAFVLPAQADERTDPPPLTPLEDFVETVLDATRLLSEQHVKPVSQGQLVDWAITDLYLRLGEKAVFQRRNGKYIDRMMVSGGDEDDWGVKPDPGFVVRLSREERLALQEHLSRQEIIPPLIALSDTPPPFTDRQLEAAWTT